MMASERTSVGYFLLPASKGAGRSMAATTLRLPFWAKLYTVKIYGESKFSSVELQGAQVLSP